jgi:imidazolonepropionase-like amidohydrolase
MRTLITAPRLFTGLGHTLIHRGAVLVEGDRIRAAGPEAEVGRVDGPLQRLEIPDGTIVPGLIDGHTHLTCSADDRMVADAFEDDDLTATVRATDHVQAALRAGVTTLRDCGSRHRVVSRVREAIRRGIITGPRLLLSGSVITTTGGHMYFVGREVDDPRDLPQAVREQVRAGADFIKVTNTGGGLVAGNGTAFLQFDRQALRLIIDQAAELGVHVAVHSLSTAGIAEVVEAAPRTVEHLTFHRDSSGEVAYDGALVDQLVERGIPGCQVLVGWHRRAHGPLGALREDLDATTLRLLEDRIRVLNDMRARGLRIIAGSDAGMPRTWFDNFGLILDLSVRHIGMSPAESLLSATAEAARLLGLEDRGALVPGRLADLAVLAGDPFVDPRAFYGSRLTMVGGQVVWGREARA